MSEVPILLRPEHILFQILASRNRGYPLRPESLLELLSRTSLPYVIKLE